MMVYKERTVFGGDPGDLAAQQPADLEARVADTLAAVHDLDATDVSVVARGNAVVLSGFIGSPDESQRAEETALSVEGVDEVINQLTTGPALR